MTKIYCDIADIKFIKKFNKKKIVKGFTTNPSLIRKAGAKNYEDYSKNILKTCKFKPISFEVFGDDYDSMLDQALKIKTWGKNIFVKILRQEVFGDIPNKQNIFGMSPYLLNVQMQLLVNGFNIQMDWDGTTLIYSNELTQLFILIFQQKLASILG